MNLCSSSCVLGNGFGSAVNQMTGGVSVFLDGPGNVYVSDYMNHRLTKTLVSTNTTTIFAGNNGPGNATNQFNNPWGMYFDAATSCSYIADSHNHRIVRWVAGASSGTVIAGTTGVAGNTNTLLNYPIAVTFDAAGFMYVMDGGNVRVQRFTVGNPVGTTILSFTVGGAANQISGAFQMYMAFDAVGNLYISDYGYHRVQRYDLTCPITTTTTTTTTSMSCFAIISANCDDSISSSSEIDSYRSI